MDKQQVKTNIAKHPWQSCECGGMLFEENIMFKRISGIEMGTGAEPIHQPIMVLVCKSCNKIPSFIHKQLPPIPEELQSVSKFKLNTGTTDGSSNSSFFTTEG